MKFIQKLFLSLALVIALIVVIKPTSINAQGPTWEPNHPTYHNAYVRMQQYWFWDNRVTLTYNHDGTINPAWCVAVPQTRALQYNMYTEVDGTRWAGDGTGAYGRGMDTPLTQWLLPPHSSGFLGEPGIYLQTDSCEDVSNGPGAVDHTNVYMYYAELCANAGVGNLSDCMAPFWTLAFGDAEYRDEGGYPGGAIIRVKYPLANNALVEWPKDYIFAQDLGLAAGIAAPGWENNIYEAMRTTYFSAPEHDLLIRSGSSYTQKNPPYNQVGHNCGRATLMSFLSTPDSTWLASAPPFLPVMGGGRGTTNHWIHFTFLPIISPDCGDMSTPFPVSCIATHTINSDFISNPNFYGRNDSESYYCDSPVAGKYCANAVLGHEVSIDTNIRPIVPAIINGATSSYVYPGQYAPVSSEDIFTTDSAWPLPDQYTELSNTWMSAWHTSVHKQSPGVEFGLRMGVSGPVGAAIAYRSMENHPAAIMSPRYTGGYDNCQGPCYDHWFSIVPLDVRAIVGNIVDTNDGLEYFNPESLDWEPVTPAVELYAGTTYTMRVTLHLGPPQGPPDGSPTDVRGSIIVWVADRMEGEEIVYDYIYHNPLLANGIPAGDDRVRILEFPYTPSAGVTFDGEDNLAFIRIIYHSNAVPVSTAFPTSSGYEPYTCATGSCVGQFDVSTAAEPLVLGYNYAMGEIEDYRISIRQPLRVEGHTYVIPRSTTPGAIPETPLSSVPITITYVLRNGTQTQVFTQTNSDGFYYYETDADDYQFVYIDAPVSSHNMSLYKVEPGEDRTENRPDYELDYSIQTSRYTYEFTDDTSITYGLYQYNDFGYSNTTVEGTYYELISMNRLPTEPVTLTAELCYYDMLGDIVCDQELNTWYSTTDANGDFAFTLGDYDAGFTYLPRRLTLTYPETTVSGTLHYVYHDTGTPSAERLAPPVRGSTTVLPAGLTWDWIKNDVYYILLAPTIERKHPVIPPHPDLITIPIPEPRRQVVTTTLVYFDGTEWVLFDGVSDVVLNQTIVSRLTDPLYFMPEICTDGTASCSISFIVPPPPGIGRNTYVYFATENMTPTDGTSEFPGEADLPYRIFANAPESDYVVWATWTAEVQLPDETWTTIVLDTDSVGWRVVSLASPLVED